MTLSQYQQETAALLHDQSNLFTPKSQLTLWINEARRQVAQRTGCVRRLVTGQSAFGASAQPGFAVPGGMQPGALPGPTSGGTVQNAATNTCQTIPGQERYPFQGFFNPYLQAEHAGCKAIIDVIACSVNWGGSVRPTLAWLPWDDLQAYARAYATLLESFPYYWSVMNDGEQGEIWMFPAPSIVGDIELDCFCIPSDLNTDSDFDAIPGGFRNAVKFGAAELAFMAQQRFSQAELMNQKFAERIGTGAVARDRGKVQNYYWSAI